MENKLTELNYKLYTLINKLEDRLTLKENYPYRQQGVETYPEDALKFEIEKLEFSVSHLEHIVNFAR